MQNVVITLDKVKMVLQAPRQVRRTGQGSPLAVCCCWMLMNGGAASKCLQTEMKNELQHCEQRVHERAWSER